MDSRKFIAESQQSHDGKPECTPNGAKGGRASLSRKRGPPRSEAVTSVRTSETTRSHHTRSESTTTQALKPADDDRKPVIDNSFATNYFYQLSLTDDMPECHLPFSTGLCRHCVTFTGVSDLRYAPFSCSGSKLLKLPAPEDPMLNISSERLHPCTSCQADPQRATAVQERMSFLWASPSLRVCVPPTGHESPPIQIGLAELPGPLSRVRFELFKKWLEDCDENHLECRREDGLFQPSLEAPETPEMPTRLIDVSNPNGALLRLRIFPPGYRPGNEDTRYLALSHCLRRPSTQRFWTTAMNVGSRAYNGFYSSSLPPTFQHAITATQRLGIRYLWIDALCIIQEGDGLADLRRETARIGTVFRNAYSMLAASAATSCDDGFLLPAPGPPTPIIKLRFSPGRVVEDHIVYVAKNEDNFYEDVELAPLSHCAWALQERLLARRTIHFSARQAYFECSQGVRCETLTLLQSNKGPRLFSDPDFPRQLLSTPRPTRVSTIQSLFALYARLDFTMPTDRAVCLAGLESRLASVLGTRCTFGIMEEFLQRCLLWRRTRAATVGTSVKRIPYDKHTPVPSWSWMGCEGEIIFLKIDTALVEWNSSLQLVIPEAGEVDAKGSKPVLRAQVLPFQSGCGLEQEGETSWFVFANKRMSGESGWLMWDRRPVREVPDLDEHQVVVVGRKRMGIEALIPGSRAKQRYYVLIVTPVKAGGEGWERVGVGWVPGGCIYFKGDEQERDVV